MTTERNEGTTPDPVRRRRRVLIAAYHAAPGFGPEGTAGWEFAVAAAQHSDVWLITRSTLAELVNAELRRRPELAATLHPEFVDLPKRIVARKKRAWDVYWYYALWQRALTRRARQLHHEHGFDVLHHVTFANDWLPCGLVGVPDVPLVWGPVGGSSRVPLLKVGRWLGARGIVTEVLRTVSTAVPRRVWGDAAARRASLVVAQNPEVARRFASARAVVVEPNAALSDEDTGVNRTPGPRPPGAQRVAVFAGRLLGWKGARLAIDAVAHPLCADWRLDIFGEGYDRAALEQHVRALGVGDRIRFLGHRPRPELLSAFAEADAFLFPSLHDQAGWVAAEASSLGCPVVCVELGGPHVLAHVNAHVADLDGDLVENLARQLRLAAAQGGRPHERWSAGRLPALVESWYQMLDSTATGGDRVRS